MVEFAGKYQLVEAVNSEEILKLAGQQITVQALEQWNSTNSTLTVQVDGDNYAFSTKIGDTFRREVRFTLGEPFVEGTLGVQKKTETTVTRVNNKLIFISATGRKRIERYYDFTESGVTFVLDTGTGLRAKRIYRKL